jgi:hypothetical protein
MIKDFVGKKINIARLIGGIIFFFWMLGNLMMSVSLLLQSRYYAATGWVIVLIISIFFTYLFFLVPKGERIFYKWTSKHIKAKTNKPDENLVLIISTKDYVRIGQVKEALQNNGITSVILDQHSAVMMSFLPDVEMRLMVKAKNFESSMRIVKNLLEE